MESDRPTKGLLAESLGNVHRRPIAVLVGMAMLAAFPAAARADELEDPGRLAAVQKRKYRLDHELFVSATFLPWDAFYKGVGPSGSYTWHFSDRVGWEVIRGTYAYGFPTSLRDQLEKDFKVAPTRFEQLQLVLDSALMWKPLYGKFALANRGVVHAEMFCLVGGALAQLTDRTYKAGPQVGVGWRFFLNTWISYRLDARYDLLVAKKMTHVVDLTTGLAFNLGGTD
jgi:outer membrane beta-barrel protein